MTASETRLRAYARKLASLSLDKNGRPDPARVDAVLAVLRETPGSAPVALLRRYLAIVERYEAMSTAVVEHAGDLDETGLSRLRAALEKRHGRALVCQTRENAALLAGVRVTVGDDVWEDSLAARLETLQAALNA